MRKLQQDPPSGRTLRAVDPPSTRGPEAFGLIQRVAETSSDLDSIDALARDCQMGEPFSAREELTRPWTRIWIVKLRDQSAPVPAEIVAFLVAWHVADELHVLNVATAPARRGRGIATALMNEALRYSAEQHVRIVLLEVRRSNRAALRLYRHLGFTAMGVRPGYYGDNNEDAIEMVISLDPATGAIVPGKDEIRIDA